MEFLVGIFMVGDAFSSIAYSKDQRPIFQFGRFVRGAVGFGVVLYAARKYYSGGYASRPALPGGK